VNKKQKEQFYIDEFNGVPLREHMTFRCTSPLMRWIRTKAMEEGRDASAVIRRLVTFSAQKEGYDKNGI
tara:strand:- start:1 stop:207 length:207 start_codon:yes stop_codon:yes gene_type:complete